jgi:hypothetical protein
MVGYPVPMFGSMPIKKISDSLPFEYTIAGWPVASEHAREALEKMKKTHRVNYLDAFDVNSKRIHPLKYRQCLQGAVVQIHFRMTHWAFPAKKGLLACDTFVSDLVSMRVLVPPAVPKGPTTPKRKFTMTDPFTPDISPKRFRNFASPVCKYLSELVKCC